MRRKLKLLDALMIVMGSMIGSGVFIVSSDIMRQLGSGWWFVLVWMITGIMMVCGAFCYGELSSIFPKAGGQYTFLTEIFGKATGFLYGWGFFTVIQTGIIAAVTMAFAKFTVYLIPWLNDAAPLYQAANFRITWIQILAILVIVGLTYVNTKGINSGKIVQNIFTLSKIIVLAGLIIPSLIMVKESLLWDNLNLGLSAFQNLKGEGWVSISGTTLLAGIASAMTGAIFSSITWENITFIAEEVENPSKTIVRSMVLGTLSVMVLYVLCNIAYLNILDRDSIAFAPKDRIAISSIEKTMGKKGELFMAILVMVSTFGCANGIILSGARVFQTMAKNGLFFQKAAKNNENGVPERSLWLQCIWASLLCLSGQYGDLLDMVSFVIVLFYMLTIFGMMWFRFKKNSIERPYKAFLYPLTPILYLLIGLFFCILLVIYKPHYTWPGLMLTLAGIPVYYLIRKKRKKSSF